MQKIARKFNASCLFERSLTGILLKKIKAIIKVKVINDGCPAYTVNHKTVTMLVQSDAKMTLLMKKCQILHSVVYRDKSKVC